MIIFIIAIVILGIAIFLIYNNKMRKRGFKEEKYKRGNWVKILLIINICIICFFRFIFPGVTKYANTTICFYLSLLINIVTIVLVFNKKLLKSKVIYNSIIIIYFLLMIGLPIYSYGDHKHIFDDTRNFPYNEKIIEYTDYYNCYGLKLHRKIK
ncbi:MAG: hypothetical protein ACI4VH_02605 [Clostridia bacterium]